MYTASPVSEILYGGYFIAFAGCFIFWLFMRCIDWAIEDKFSKLGKIDILYWGTVVFISIMVFFATPKPTKPLNLAVKACQVGEGGQMESTGGKAPKNYFQMYVFYQTPDDGIVALRRSEGKIYPQCAILYKN